LPTMFTAKTGVNSDAAVIGRIDERQQHLDISNSSPCLGRVEELQLV